MNVQAATLGKIQILEALYRRGYQSQIIEHTVDKLIVLEQERTQRELANLDSRLQAFETGFDMSSEEFYRRYEAGKLGDSAEFMEWASFFDMRIAVRQMCGRLAEE
ncbi:MAG TPA: hypothetical protein PLH19_03970 [Anaerolineae bacterium]|nr:hypothetical protein [Anaerolineae bacterium]HQH37679.1 hypothetical protein [Anaerolineae bacterium]